MSETHDLTQRAAQWVRTLQSNGDYAVAQTIFDLSAALVQAEQEKSRLADAIAPHRHTPEDRFLLGTR